ncbi:hypothetical protein EZS27_024033 [termite gut metagenome]|uniref:Bacteriocin-protection, YdeI or OmpD-Associated n=1 Tax=termite gut metagenome TaxID=433724 RepID=A0A5J4QZH6_9ZZZZ
MDCIQQAKDTPCLTATEALEEALCFGWIDGQVQSIDDSSYRKYFKQRKAGSNWSEKNKKLVANLELRGLITGYGRAKIEAAKKNGKWETVKTGIVTEEHIQAFEAMLMPFETAYNNFINMPESVRKSYTSSYIFGAKTGNGKQKRLATIIERLNLNLNPMESMKKKLENEVS